MRPENTGQQIVDQELALDSYLSTLLDAIPSEYPLDDSSLKKAVNNQTKIVEKLKPAKVLKAEQKEVVEEKEKVYTRKIEKKLNPLLVMPDWANHEFQALFFKVDKLVFAAPVTQILRTIKFNKAPTRIPGQPSWFIGLLDTQEQQIGILDTGQLVYGKTKGQQRNCESHPFENLLISHDGKWGLVCDEILSIGKLKPKMIRWRATRDKRPWLIGIQIEKLTSVLDINQLVPKRTNEKKPYQYKFRQ